MRVEEDREYTYRRLHRQVLFALVSTRERKVFRFLHASKAVCLLPSAVSHCVPNCGRWRTVSTLSVTHNFLLKICATPPRLDSLRLSIPSPKINEIISHLFSAGGGGYLPLRGQYTFCTF